MDLVLILPHSIAFLLHSNAYYVKCYLLVLMLLYSYIMYSYVYREEEAPH